MRLGRPRRRKKRRRGLMRLSRGLEWTSLLWLRYRAKRSLKRRNQRPKLSLSKKRKKQLRRNHLLKRKHQPRKRKRRISQLFL
jgi:hypothetical protein